MKNFVFLTKDPKKKEEKILKFRINIRKFRNFLLNHFWSEYFDLWNTYVLVQYSVYLDLSTYSILNFPENIYIYMCKCLFEYILHTQNARLDKCVEQNKRKKNSKQQSCSYNVISNKVNTVQCISLHICMSEYIYAIDARHINLPKIMLRNEAKDEWWHTYIMYK